MPLAAHFAFSFSSLSGIASGAIYMQTIELADCLLFGAPTLHDDERGAYLADVDAETAAHLMRVGQAAAAALRASGLPCEGVNLFLADGEAAMQEVFHVHLHVFPRFRADGFGLKFSPEYYTRRPARAELDQAAAMLRSRMSPPPSSA